MRLVSVFSQSQLSIVLHCDLMQREASKPLHHRVQSCSFHMETTNLSKSVSLIENVTSPISLKQPIWSWRQVWKAPLAAFGKVWPPPSPTLRGVNRTSAAQAQAERKEMAGGVKNTVGSGSAAHITPRLSIAFSIRNTRLASLGWLAVTVCDIKTFRQSWNSRKKVFFYVGKLGHKKILICCHLHSRLKYMQQFYLEAAYRPQ